MDFLGELKVELSDYGKIAEKDGFVDLGGETYVYSPALRVPLRRDHGGVANLRGPRWRTVVGWPSLDEPDG
jgi:hypothetical protein